MFIQYYITDFEYELFFIMFRPRLLTSACIEITLIYDVEIAGIFKNV